MEGIAASLGLRQTERPKELDTTAHVGNWSEVLGTGALPLLVAACVLHRVFCYTKGRAVNESDAPELEVMVGASGKKVNHNDSTQIKNGRTVAGNRAKPLAVAEEPRDVEQGSRRERRAGGAARPGAPRRSASDGERGNPPAAKAKTKPAAKPRRVRDDDV